MDKLRINIRKFVRVVLIIMLLGLVVAVFLFYYVQFRDTDKELKRFFADKQVPVSIGYYTSHNRSLRYLKAGDARAKAAVLFIHGAPSSMSYFKKYLTDDAILQRACLLAIDRPGYGYSGFGNPEPSIALQSAMIRPLLDSLQRAHHPLILVGASYGTSVACRIAMDYPDLVDGLILVAPSLAPGEERIYPITYFIEHAWVKWLIPSMFVSANAEKLHHRQELEKMLPYWKKIRVPVVYMQGENDHLIYTTNALFAKNQLVHAPCLDVRMIPGRGHLIAFSEKDKITQAILEMVEQVKKD